MEKSWIEFIKFLFTIPAGTGVGMILISYLPNTWLSFSARKTGAKVGVILLLIGLAGRFLLPLFL